MSTFATDAPLSVSTDAWTTGPYVIVAPEQYGRVAEALRSEGVPFRLDPDAVLLGGGPPWRSSTSALTPRSRGSNGSWIASAEICARNEGAGGVRRPGSSWSFAEKRWR